MAIGQNKMQRLFLRFLKEKGIYSTWRKGVITYHDSIYDKEFYAIWDGKVKLPRFDTAFRQLIQNMPSNNYFFDKIIHNGDIYSAIPPFLANINIRKF